MSFRSMQTLDPWRFRANVGDGVRTEKYRKGQVVFAQGTPADAVFYIQKGKTKLTIVSAQGKEAVVAILGAGDFIGEECLDGQPYRAATATAMTDSAIVRLTKGALRKLLHDQSEFSDMFIAYL